MNVSSEIQHDYTRLAIVDSGGSEDGLAGEPRLPFLASFHPPEPNHPQPMSPHDIKLVKSKLDDEYNHKESHQTPTVRRKTRLRSLALLRAAMEKAEAVRGGASEQRVNVQQVDDDRDQYEFVGYKRHFSQRSLSELKQINISNMMTYSLHTGRCLICRVASQPSRKGDKITFGVEDCTGSVLMTRIRFPALLDAPTMVLDTIFPLGASLAIREPTVELTGPPSPNPFILVNSHSDIVFLEPTDPVLLHITWEHPAPSNPFAGQTATDWQTRGNGYFTDDHIFASAVAYSKGLECDPAAYILRLNRAAAYLRLEYFEAAIADTAAVLASAGVARNERLKAHYRAAQAQYRLGRYYLALDGFKQCISIAPEFVGIKGWVSRCAERIQESMGSYNWVRMYKEALIPGSGLVDAADFVGPIKVGKSSRGGGRGIVATRDVKVGDLLLVANPLVSAFTHEFTVKHELGANFITNQVDGWPRHALISKLITKLAGNPALYDTVAALYAGPTFPAPPPEFPPATQPDTPCLSNPLHVKSDMDVSLLEHICTYNAFYLKNVTHNTAGCRTLSRDFLKLPAALYLLPSLFNHSCVPSATWHHFGDVMVIRATKAVAAGEELTLSYISGPGDTIFGREAELKVHMAKCDCPLCDADRGDGRAQCSIRAVFDLALRHGDYRDCDTPEHVRAKIEQSYAPSRGALRPTMFRYHYLATDFMMHDAGDDPALRHAIVAEAIKALEAAGVVVKDKTTSFTLSAPEVQSRSDALVIGTDSAPTYMAQMCVELMLVLAELFLYHGDVRMAGRWINAAFWLEGVHVGGGREMFFLRHAKPLLKRPLLAAYVRRA
ncbi:hypothetical protein BOTBODRAFT_29154 [Botryobasidium botryosum FD-172 SS1]|uniref:SET domain-containing protein n=1 Tax=Botryobasidium botryosum (strain FD-172 SS1) TaxID=930990 RepID=A0A067MT35_BOTB1|nr:hypothetical protein BOTBODRAFT_29154 [Botryobasidium botryosum FD-172 SS1]